LHLREGDGRGEVDDVANAIELEGEELQGLHDQLNDLLEEGHEREKEEEVVATLLRLQVQLEATLQTLHTFCLLLDQVLEQADEGFPSRLLFSSDHLTNALLHLNDRHARLSPHFSASYLSRYFSFPLATATLSTTHLNTTLRIPLVSSSQKLQVLETSHHTGLVTLTNRGQKVELTFHQYETCLRSSNREEAILCWHRPCLVALKNSVTCITANVTTFKLFSPTNLTFTSLCQPGGHEVFHEAAAGQLTLHLPIHCSIHSAQFEIESVTTLSKSMSDLVTISTSESQVEEAFHWPEFQNHGWQSSDNQASNTRESLATSFKSHHGILIIYGAGSSLCGILLLAVLVSRLGCRVTTTMQTNHDDQNGEKRVEAESEPAALQHSPLTESYPSYTYPSLLEEKLEERMKEFKGVIELECLHPTCKECVRMREEGIFGSSSTCHDIKERTVESLNLPSSCNLSLSIFNSSSPTTSSPPPSYSSFDSSCPSPYNENLPSASTLLEFNVLLTLKEKDLMSSCLDRLMKKLVDPGESRVLLHLPEPIPGHNLSLFRIL